MSRGDSLYSIAKRYDTTVNDIIKFNKLTTNNLYIGQKLKIPELSTIVEKPKDYKIYTVIKGDSLYNIAKGIIVFDENSEFCKGCDFLCIDM